VAAQLVLGPEDLAAIDAVFPAGALHGDRYSPLLMSAVGL